MAGPPVIAVSARQLTKWHSAQSLRILPISTAKLGTATPPVTAPWPRDPRGIGHRWMSRMGMRGRQQADTGTLGAYLILSAKASCTPMAEG